MTASALEITRQFFLAQFEASSRQHRSRQDRSNPQHQGARSRDDSTDKDAIDAKSCHFKGPHDNSDTSRTMVRARSSSRMDVDFPYPTDGMAANTVGRRTSLMTAGARKQISSRLLSMRIRRIRIAPHPPGRMRVAPGGQVAAHAVLDMTRIAVRSFVAAQAAPRLGTGLDGVSRQKVCAMHHVAFDGVRSLLFHRHNGTQIMARLAIRLSVTGVAEALLGDCLSGVTTQKHLVVGQNVCGNVFSKSFCR